MLWLCCMTGAKEMRNRDRYILKMNEYDLLMKIQATTLTYNCCVIEALTGKPHCTDDKACILSTCETCIQKWLNEES